MADPATLRRIQAGFLEAAAQGRTAADVGAFRAFFSGSPEPFLSLALPRENTESWDDAIAALEAAFAERQRTPRLEVFAELFPTLGEALKRSSFTQDDAAPVMALSAADFSPVVPDADYRPLTVGEGLEAFLYAQSRAYGGPEDGALGWLPHLEAGLEGGYILGAALWQGDKPVAGATVILGGEVGELAGVWTEAALRRRGLAERVCRPLLSSFFGRGGKLGWLSAAPGAEGLYKRLGFSEVGMQINYSKQPS